MRNKKEMTIYEDGFGQIRFPQGKTFRISYDATNDMLRLACYSQNELERIADVYSDVNPASFFMRQYGYDVPKRISVINRFGYFSGGLVFEILKYIKIHYGSLDYVAMSDGVKRYIKDYLLPLKGFISEKGIFEIDNVSEDSGVNSKLREEGKSEFKFREYQKMSIEKLMFEGYGRGIIEVGTAGGKSFILGNYIYNLQKHVNNDFRFLILVPNKQLVYQMYGDFLDYGFEENDITRFSGGLKKHERYNPNAKIIIANRQYVFTNLKELPNIDVMICDEVHTTLAKKTMDVINAIGARIRIGCTGSIPKSKYDRWQLIGSYGNIVYTKGIGDLQKDGYVSNMKLYQINITDTVVQNDRNYLFHLNPKRRYMPDENGYSEIPFNAAHDAEHEYYEKHYKDLYKPAFEYISKFDGNTLLLFDRIEFGKRLMEMSHDIFKDKKIHYIDGSIPIEERLKITNQMEESGDNVLFAEFATYSTGINVRRLTNLVFVSSSKSFPRILQSIGRTLRKHETKKEARVFDINFNFKYSRRHLEERLRIYRQTYNKVPDEKMDIVI